MPELQARARLEIAGVEAAFEQEDRAAPAELAHALGFGDVEQRETVGTTQRGKDIGDAVTVGVGLDHGPDLGTGRGAARDLEVGGEGVEMDERFNRPRHGRILPVTSPLVGSRQRAKNRVL